MEGILLPYQKNWVEDLSDVKFCEKSRRIGLTWAEAVDDVLLAAGAKGMDVYYISYNFEFAKEFVATCAIWAKNLNRAGAALGEEIVRVDEAGELKEYKASKLTFPSGHRIMGLPARATTIRGRQGKIVIDEAAFCDNLEELMKAALAMLMWGGRVVVISTHNGEDNLFNEIIKDIKSGKRPYALHRITINDALRQGLYKRICAKKGESWSARGQRAWLDDLIKSYGDGASEELFCIPSKGGLRYFSQELIERCMNADIPICRYEQKDSFTFLPAGRRIEETSGWLADNLDPLLDRCESGVYLGEDFARSGDLTVISLSRLMATTYRKGLVNIEMRNIPFDQQFFVLEHVIEKLGRKLHGASLDARGNGQQIAEQLQQRFGRSVVNAVMITTGFYAEYMPILKSRFETAELEIPESQDIADDFRLVTMIGGVPRIPDLRTAEMTGGKRKLRHGDTVVAELMIEHAIKTDTGGCREYSYEPVKVKNPFLQTNDDPDSFEWRSLLL